MADSVNHLYLLNSYVYMYLTRHMHTRVAKKKDRSKNEFSSRVGNVTTPLLRTDDFITSITRNQNGQNPLNGTCTIVYVVVFL